MADTDNYCNLIVRAENPDRVTILHGDDESVLMTVRADRETRKFMAEVKPHSKFVLMNVVGASESEFDHEVDDGIFNRNWKIEDGTFVCWHPDTDQEITLDVMPKPGPFTPRGVPEIHGQQHVLYDVCLALKEREHMGLVGPTGTGKTSLLEWLAQTLNYNYVLMPITRDTDAGAMVGEYQPGHEVGSFPWTDGPVAHAARASQGHPTILCLDEANRIGNVAHYTKIYSLLGDQRTLVIPEKRTDEGNLLSTGEVIPAGDLFVFATANPVDYEEDAVGAADYIGVQELDPAFQSRFAYFPPINYPPKEIEAAALVERVPGLQPAQAELIVDACNRVRNAANVRFPMSFREMYAWAKALRYHTYARAAEIAVFQKAPAIYRDDLRRMLALQTERDLDVKSD